jgi:uncharacterized phage-associated protein
MSIHFQFNRDKALAALAFIAAKRPNLSPFFVSKILFFADKAHVNRFGRPIIGDDYIAMRDGPVPSTVKNYIDENWDRTERPNGFDEAIRIKKGWWLRWVHPGKEGPNLALLSQTDQDCIAEAIAFCEGKSKDELSEITHHEKSWKRAHRNRSMDYADFIDDDNPHQAEIASILKETAACGAL